MLKVTQGRNQIFSPEPREFKSFGELVGIARRRRHTPIGQCTSDCRRVGCPEVEEDESVDDK